MEIIMINIEMIQDLTNAFGPSGFEEEVVKVIAKHKNGMDIANDAMNNVFSGENVHVHFGGGDAEDEEDSELAHLMEELEDAEEELIDAESELENAQSALEDAQSEADDAQQDVDDAAEEVEAARKAVEAARAAVDVAAEDEISDAEDALSEAEDELADAEDALEPATLTQSIIQTGTQMKTLTAKWLNTLRQYATDVLAST